MLGEHLLNKWCIHFLTLGLGGLSSNLWGCAGREVSEILKVPKDMHWVFAPSLQHPETAVPLLGEGRREVYANHRKVPFA